MSQRSEDDREPSELAASVIGANQPVGRVREDSPPNAGMGVLGLVLYPYRRVVLVLFGLALLLGGFVFLTR